MSPVIISDKTIDLSVGLYRLHIEDCGNSGVRYLPKKADNFIDNSNTSHTLWDINYRIEPNPDFIEPEAAPLACVSQAVKPYRIYRTSSGSYLWIRCSKYKDIQLVYLISEDWSSWHLIYHNTDRLATDGFEELAYIFAYSVLNKKGIVFHGVVMDWNGMGVIVCAHSGVGKTTHTNMWREGENAVILNGDRALCCKEGETWYTYGSPWCGSSKDHINRGLPLKAVVILEQAEANQVSRLSSYQGFLELLQLAFAPDWEEKLFGASLNTMDDIVAGIPVLKLSCRPDSDSVEALKSELIRIKDSESMNSSVPVKNYYD